MVLRARKTPVCCNLLGSPADLSPTVFPGGPLWELAKEVKTVFFCQKSFTQWSGIGYDRGCRAISLLVRGFSLFCRNSAELLA
jgi:hypothetical protein